MCVSDDRPAPRGRAAPTKLAIVVSHPIQHFAPFYRALAEHPEIALTVIFCSRIGLSSYFDEAMNTKISWSMDLVGGYDHLFLPEAERISSTRRRQINNPSVTRSLRAIDPSAVILHGYGHPTMRRALRWCRRGRKPALLFSDSSLRYKRSAIRRIVKGIVLRRMYRQFSAFLAISDANKAYHQHYGASENCISKVPFPIDEKSFLAARSRKQHLRAAVRERHDIQPDQTVLLSVGKIIDYKRIDDIIETARLAKAQLSDCPVVFLIVGDGPDRQRMMEIADRESLPMRFAGFINVDELPDYYAAADILLHACGIESFGLVVSEACAMGLPLILPKEVGAVGPNSPAQPGRNALVFEAGNTSQMFSRICELIADGEKRNSFALESEAIYDSLNMAKSVQGVVDALHYVLPSPDVVEAIGDAA